MSLRLVSSFGAFILATVFMLSPMAFAQQSGGGNTTVETFQDWEVRCPEQSGSGGCEMTQLVNSPDNGKPILRVVMGYPPEIDTAAMVFILPLGTRLAPGVQLQVDNGEAQAFPFQICLEQGCRADFPVNDALRNRMRSGSTATVSLIDPQGERMDLNVSLQGFTDADNRIRR
ncbi:invasion associated locus B family protein [Endozoicomonas sp. G2_2]|uniref:invasion associated locus B family protein n=1 Tax=Endozoicomonas sp. G2_2 TaxID=2821092 RepID=UPI001ADB1649|nr:invasion associated locus B family protein [Endozoicomonas sp. G2_2]MBO9469013.1 invasion associated locus B family protein [Endozoicomonas sp. G2_2]